MSGSYQWRGLEAEEMEIRPIGESDLHRIAELAAELVGVDGTQPDRACLQAHLQAFGRIRR